MIVRVVRQLIATPWVLYSLRCSQEPKLGKVCNTNLYVCTYGQVFFIYIHVLCFVCIENIESYKPPFTLSGVSLKPTVTEMREIVCNQHIRPEIPDRFNVSADNHIDSISW